jgi:hypothetical protein
MVVESEETYLQEFDLDNSHQDTAMREARDDWLRMDAEKQKKHDKTKYVAETAYKNVKMKKASYVRARRSEALKSVRDHTKEKARREKRDMPRTPPPLEEEEESESRSRITQLCWLEHEVTAVHTRLEQALIELRRLMGTMSSVRTHEVAILNEDEETVGMKQ